MLWTGSHTLKVSGLDADQDESIESATRIAKTQQMHKYQLESMLEQVPTTGKPGAAMRDQGTSGLDESDVGGCS